MRIPFHFLLADDDDDDHDLFKEALGEIAPGITLSIIKDGEKLMEVLSAAGADLPDLIFMDLNMPRKDGRVCLKEIVSHPRLSHIPVIIYSTSSNSKDIDETFQIGAHLYISKPSSFKELKQVLKKVIAIDWEKGYRVSDRDAFFFSNNEKH